MAVPFVLGNVTLPHLGGDAAVGVAREYSSGDVAWVITASAMVWLMLPGVGFFYSGLTGQKSALSMIMLSFIAMSVGAIQWFLLGYSLTFSQTGSMFIGNFDNVAFKGILGCDPGDSSHLVFALFQGMFAAFTPALLVGAAGERGRLLPCMIFVFAWATLVYDPIASWTWNKTGWAYCLGVLDFAGGTPVHISSGAAALAYSLFLGKRKRETEPHNATYVALGTVFLWFGWFGFNGGSARGGNERAVMACIVSNLSASVGGLTWIIVDYIQLPDKKWGTIGWCSGAVAGLVSITPAAGFVPPWSALIFGAVAGFCCNYATRFKFRVDIDEHLDIFAIHAIGGVVGNLLTGIFAAKYIAALDGVTKIDGGWLDGHFIQLAYQLCNCVVGIIYSFIMTCIILFVMNLSGLHLRVTEDEEEKGIDPSEIGYFAYDYIHEDADVQEVDEEDDSGQSYNTNGGSLLEQSVV